MHRTIYLFALLILGAATPWVAAQPPGANFGNPRGGFQGGGRGTTSTETGALPAAWANSLKWRNIGPANMSGRITSIAVYEKEPSTWWASSASGGLLKTTDNGITFEFQFDREATVSVGDVQVFQGDPNIVWVGTGEANPRNSASWGDGVYKSTDGGKTWKNMGLNKTAHTGRIALHPTNPDIAYVGALGRLWGSNEERGLFKTVDGGKTWEKVFYLDADTGIIDVQMNPSNPETLIVAAYQRRRDGFDGNDPAVKFGANAGIYRTVDGGKTFERLKQGLPTVKMGRIGLNYYRKDPNFVYAIIETEKIGNWPKDSSYSGVRGEDADAGAKLLEVTKDGPAAKAGLEVGDIILRVDGEAVLSYSKLIEFLRRKPAGTKVKLEISRNREPKSLELELGRRPEVEALEKRIKEAKEPLTEDQIREGSPFAQSLGGQNPNMHDEQGAEGFEMGGVYRSADGGTTWQRINSVNPRPMYYSQIRVDPSDNNHLWVLGTELYRSKDGGETFTPDGHGSDVHVDHHSMWIDPRDGKHVILGNDGGIYVTYSWGEHWDHHNHVAIGQFYHVGVASDRDYYVYGGLQDNGSWGGPSVVRNNPGPVNGDWMNIGGGDGFICLVDPTDPNQLYSESQNGAMGRLNLATGERGSIRPRAPQGKEYRFNWKTPFILSNHNPEIFYAAGNYVFRSLRKGNEIKEISPQITVDKQGTGSAIAESPVDERFLIVGTTDGQLWSTRDFGQTWVDLWNSPEKLLSSEDSRRQGGAPGGQGGGPGGQVGGMGPGGPGSGRGFRGGPGGPGGGFRGRRGQGDPAAPGDPAAATAPPAQEAPAQDPPGTVRVTMPEQAAPPAPAAEAPNAEATAAAPASPAAPAKDDGSAKVVGSWQGGFTSDMLPPQRSRFQLTISKNAEGKLEGTFRSSQSDGNLQSISFDAATGQLEAGIATGGAEMKLTGKVDGEKLTGQMSINSGAFVIPFAADRASATAAPASEASTADASSDGSKPLKELLPKQLWISSLECSRVVAGRAYVTVDGHRSDDYLPYVFVTENYGRTWKSIRSNLPDNAGTAWVLREDLKNPNTLYLGTEMGAWVSIDRGANWTKMNSNLPTVAVHELAQHPTSGEVVAATHGRSLWIADITALRQFTPEKVKSGNHLYAPNELIRWRRMPEAGSSGTRRFVGENPASDVKIHYSLGEQAQSVQIEVKDIQGRRVAILTGATQSGLQTVSWDTRRILAPVAEATATTTGRGFGGGGFGGRFGGGRVGSGTYQVGLIIDGEVVATQPLVISEDPDYQGPEQRTSTELEMFEALFSSVEEEEEEGSSSEEENKDQ